MKRKWFYLAVCLLLALALPVNAMAAMRHTLSIQPGDLILTASGEEAVGDLFDALSLSFLHDDDAVGMCLSVGDEDIADYSFKLDTAGLYMASNLFGDDVLFVRWEDLSAMLSEASAEISGMGAQTLMPLLNVLQAVAANDLAANGLLQTAQPEGMKALAETMYPDDKNMQEYLEGIVNNISFEEGSFTAEGRDAATGKLTFAMDQSDIMSIIESDYMRRTIEMTIRTTAPDLSDEEIDQTLDQAMQSLQDMYEGMDYTMDLTAYTLDEGTALAGLDMEMKMAFTVEDAEQTMSMTVVYDRLSSEKGVQHTARLTEEVAGVTVEGSFDLMQGADGVSEGMLAFLSSGSQYSFVYNAKNEDDVRHRTLDLYMRAGAVSIIEPAAADRPLLSFEVSSGEDDSGLLDAVEDATSETAVDLLKLSEEEMLDLARNFQTRAMQAVYQALANLPASVIELMGNVPLI